jgi:RNA polymerase subunit RPABC4/transcription elongation factor Spt4
MNERTKRDILDFLTVATSTDLYRCGYCDRIMSGSSFNCPHCGSSALDEDGAHLIDLDIEIGIISQARQAIEYL